MAGSYRHVTNDDGSYRGMELIDNLGDASEAIEEMWWMIHFLTGGNRQGIYRAWFEGYAKGHCPPENLPEFSADYFWNP